MELTKEERALIEYCRSLSEDCPLGCSLRGLVPIIDRLTQVPVCDGCVHKNKEFRTKCVNCIRHVDTRTDRYKKEE